MKRKIKKIYKLINIFKKNNPKRIKIEFFNPRALSIEEIFDEEVVFFHYISSNTTSIIIIFFCLFCTNISS